MNAARVEAGRIQRWPCSWALPFPLNSSWVHEKKQRSNSHILKRAGFEPRI
jgi:hypothetical protein